MKHWPVRFGVCDSSLPASSVTESVLEAAIANAPVVLVHGFAQSATSWDDVGASLAQYREVYALDLVGHGSSERLCDPCAYALGAQAKALFSFLAYVANIEGVRPVVVGYSMGGRVVLAAAVRNTQAFLSCASGLVLEAAGLGWATREERDAFAVRDAHNAAQLRACGVEAFMDAWEQLPLFATQRNLPAHVKQRVRSGRLANDPEALAHTFEYAGQHTMPPQEQVLAVLADLHKRTFPMTYIAGELDTKYCALAARAAEVGAQVRIVPNVGHNVHLEAPDAFVREIRLHCKVNETPDSLTC